jgi:hypothetical protein
MSAKMMMELTMEVILWWSATTPPATGMASAIREPAL